MAIARVNNKKNRRKENIDERTEQNQRKLHHQKNFQ
jgi:hypothetical protein